MDELLLVDNDRRIVDLAAWFLERRGFAVRAVLSYRDARVAIREKRPDLMLADLELGDENGREELPRLAQEGLLPRTLVVSGFLDAALDAELRALDAVVDTLAKPYDMDRLEACIRACLALPVPGAHDESAQRDSHAPSGDSVNRHGELTPQPPPADRAGTRASSASPAHLDGASNPATPSNGPQSNDSTPSSNDASAADDDDDEWIEIAPRSRPEDYA